MAPALIGILGLAWAGPAEATAAEGSGWEFAATFYAWLSDLEGDVRPKGTIEPVAVDLSHGDVLDSLKFAAFGTFEARKNRLIVLSDLTYAHLGASKGINIRDVYSSMPTSMRPRSPALWLEDIGSRMPASRSIC